MPRNYVRPAVPTRRTVVGGDGVRLGETVVFNTQVTPNVRTAEQQATLQREIDEILGNAFTAPMNRRNPATTLGLGDEPQKWYTSAPPDAEEQLVKDIETWEKALRGYETWGEDNDEEREDKLREIKYAKKQLAKYKSRLDKLRREKQPDICDIIAAEGE
jgi:hypothetical protein